MVRIMFERIFNFSKKIIVIILIINFSAQSCFAECLGENGEIEINSDNENPAENASKISKAMDTLKFIPGIGLLIPAFTYMGLVGSFNTEGSAEGIELAGEVAGVVGDIFNPSTSESKSSTSLQIVFGSNLYCKQQRIYMEESQYVSKLEASPDGGYPMFPVYPMNIDINTETGQCNLSSAIDDRFLSINNPGSGSNLNPSNSKCTYSFSATSDQCILDMNIPIFTLYAAQIPVVEGICAYTYAKKPNDAAKSASKIKKAINIAKIVAEIAGKVGTQLFLDNRMALDPISMLSIFAVESAVEIILNGVSDLLSGGLPCTIARITSTQIVYYASLSTIAGVADYNYKKAKNSIKEYTFCGYDWLSYKETEDRKYWVRGPYCETSKYSDDKNDAYCNSYYRTVINAVEKNDTLKNINEEKFREYTYGGKEYDSGIPESDNSDLKIEYDKDYCIDPRTPEQKGFDTITQRYYMRGNDKANFACNRFFYDGESDCILLEKDLTDSEKRMNTKVLENYYRVSSSEHGNMCKKTFEKARECCEYRSKHLVCIEKKVKDFDKKENLHKKGEYTFCFSHVFDSYQDIPSNLVTFLVNRKNDKYGPTCKLDGIEFEPAKKIKTDYVCVYSYGLCPYNFKLNAGLNYRASYCDTNYFSNYSDRSDVLQRGATHFNKVTCRHGLFSEQMREQYKELFGGSPGRSVAAYTYEKVRNDMKDFNKNDFERIYNFDKYTGDDITKKNIESCGMEEVDADFDGNSKRLVRYDLTPIDVINMKSSAFGQVKNFCQYRAHCVEVEREQEYDNNYITGSLFLDSSCSGKSSNSRNILQGDTGIIFRQFSAPIAECIFESFKNLVNGVAGNSLCKNGETTNGNGYCGSDDEKTIETQYKNGNNAFFESRYEKIDGKYIVKGYNLPESYNPFLKIQKYFINITKAALALFLVIYFYKKLLLGDLESFVKPENISKLVFSAFKFAIVIWLIFYNGWQDGVYNYLVNFATASYSFVNDIFVKSVNNPKNQMLNLDKDIVIRIVEKYHQDNQDDQDTKNPVLLCYRYDAFGNITFSRRDIIVDDVIRRCEKGFNSLYTRDANIEKASEIKIKAKNYKGQNINEGLVISNNQEISQLIRFIEDYNRNNSANLIIEINRNGSWSSVENSDLWNENYDGCYFDSTEYKEGKNYLAAFDTLDCKLVRYIGYSTNNAAPSLILYSLIMLVPNFFFPDGLVTNIINGIGSLVFGLMMTFLFVVFNIILKTIYIFTSAFFTLSILIFISPIVLPLMFFERTKNIFDTWLEYIMESVIKPALNFAFLVIYVNLMDIILLKNTTFNKHGINGRGPNIICPEGSSSFVCFINGIPGIQQIKALFNSGLKQVLIDILIVFVFFKMSDQILDDIERIASSIFKSLSDPNKSSPSSFNITTKDGNGKIVGGVNSGFKTAIEVGKQVEAVRHNYLNNAPGALFSKANKFVKEIDNNRENNEKDDGSKSEETFDKMNVVGKATVGLVKKASNTFEAKEGDSKFKKGLKKAGNAALTTGAVVTTPFTTISAIGSQTIRGAAKISEGIEKLHNLREDTKMKVDLFFNKKGQMAKIMLKNTWDDISLKRQKDDIKASKKLEEATKYIEIHKKIVERNKVKAAIRAKEAKYEELKLKDKGGKSEEREKAKEELEILEKELNRLSKKKELGTFKIFAKANSRKYLEDMEYIKKHAGTETFRKMNKLTYYVDDGKKSKAEAEKEAQRAENAKKVSNEIFKEAPWLVAKRTKQALKDNKKLLKYNKRLQKIRELEPEVENGDSEEFEKLTTYRSPFDKNKKYDRIFTKRKNREYQANIDFINEQSDDDSVLEIYDKLSSSETKKSSIVLNSIQKRVIKAKVHKSVEENLELLENELKNEGLEDNEENLGKVKEKLKNNEKYLNNIKFIKEQGDKDSVLKLLDSKEEKDTESKANTMVERISKFGEKIKKILVESLNDKEETPGGNNKPEEAQVTRPEIKSMPLKPDDDKKTTATEPDTPAADPTMNSKEKPDDGKTD